MKIRHLVAMSGGKDSVAMAVRLRELYPDIDFEFICTPTGDELPEMLDHWVNIGKILGKPITPVTCGKSLKQLIRETKTLPNVWMRWCTRVLKIEPFANYVAQAGPCKMYVGLRADEELREGGDYAEVENATMIYPMRAWGWTITDVYAYLESKGICIPKRTDCARCFFQRLGEWKELAENHPEIYDDAIADEDYTGHTFRSPGRDQWPADLRSLRDEFKSGRKLRQRRDFHAEMKCRVCTK